MKKLSHLKIKQPHIALFGSGSSIHDLSREEFNFIKSKAFVITLNYAPILLKGHLNIWSDRRVSEFLENHFKSSPKEGLFLAQQNRVSKKFSEKIDFWFNRTEEKLKGNYTIIWALQLLQKYFPKKTILLFGVDMYQFNQKEQKWYDRYTDFDRKKRGAKYNTQSKLDQCAKQFRQYVTKQNIYNCNLNSHLDHFEKCDWQALLPLKVLHLCTTPLAGAPSHLSKIINKYSNSQSRSVLKRNFTSAKTKNLKWNYDIINPRTSELKRVIDWADIIHYHRKIYPFSIHGKKSILQYHSPPNGYTPQKTDAPFNNRKLVIAQYHPRFYTDAYVVPNLIDIWDPMYLPGRKSQDQIKIFYSWATEIKGGWSDKGSHRTIDILKRIRHQYPNRVTTVILNNRPYEECMKEKRTAHICIDECVTGSYHLQSLEGCSVGALTMNNIDEKTQSFIQEVTGTVTHPFMKSNLDELFDHLCYFIEHPKELEKKGKAARQWMEKNWDPQKLVYRYIRAYFNVMAHNKVEFSNHQKVSFSPVVPPVSTTPQTKKIQVSSQRIHSKTTIKNTMPITQDKTEPQGRPISELYQKYAGKEIYIFGTGPSLFKVTPNDFKDRICFGINYAFEVMPYINYHFVHVIETYESIREIVDNRKLILPESLVRQWYTEKWKVKEPHRIATVNPLAYIYPIQDPYQRKNINKKHANLDKDTQFFTWSCTTHSAIHIAAYMGAQKIHLIGFDYKLHPNGKVHFNSKHSPIYGQQTWNANRNHKYGDQWLIKKMSKKDIDVTYFNHSSPLPIPPPLSLPTPAKSTSHLPKSTSPKLPTSKGKPISELFQKYPGEDIYIFGTGPSIFQINPEAFKDKLCFGINYAFEVMPHMDYIFVHDMEPYDVIRKIVDNNKLILPDTLVNYRVKGSARPQTPRRVSVVNEAAYFYPMQTPDQRKIDQKQLGLDEHSPIFSWSTTTHSAIHLAAYMGAKNIYLIGVDYKLYDNKKVHFQSKHSTNYANQRWHANNKHRQGDIWLTKKLRQNGINLENLSSNILVSKNQDTPTLNIAQTSFSKKLVPIKVNNAQFQVLNHWFWKHYHHLNWEPDTYNIFKHYLNGESIFVDIGAWIGPTVFYAWDIGVRKIFGVEANPESYKMLLNNCRINNITADFHHLCILDREELVPFGNEKGGQALSSASSIRGNQWKVQSITLKHYLQTHCPEKWRLLKIDIEGAEDILADDLKWLSAKAGKVIYLSLHPPFWKDKKTSTEKLLAAFRKFRIKDNRLQDLPVDKLEAMMLSPTLRPSWGTSYGNFFEIILESDTQP